jgi:hypothetical protein
MKRLLFPFSSSYDNLTSFWWHRLFQILFIVLIALSLLYLWRWGNSQEMSPYIGCLQATAQPPATDSSICIAPEVHSGENFLVALLITIILSYIIQVVYYKVLLYIVLGKNIERHQ